MPTESDLAALLERAIQRHQGGDLDGARADYERLLATARQRGFAEGWASHRYRELFGCWPRGFVFEVRREEMRERFMEIGA